MGRTSPVSHGMAPAGEVHGPDAWTGTQSCAVMARWEIPASRPALAKGPLSGSLGSEAGSKAVSQS